MQLNPASLFARPLAVLLLAGGVNPGGAAGEQSGGLPSRVAVAGNEQVLWVFRADSPQPGTRLVRPAYRLARGAVGAVYRAGQTVVGEVARVAVRDVHLHVFFHDGTHRRFAPSVAGPFSYSGPRVFTEANLPGSAVPRALAADADREVLYALVPAATAVEVGERHARGASLKLPPAEPSESAPDPAVEPATAPALPMKFESAVGVVRYEQGQWVPDRDGPGQIDDQSRIVGLVTRDGAVHVFFRRGSGSEDLLHVRSGGAGDDAPASWSEPTLTGVGGSSELLGDGWLEKTPVLIVAAEAAGGRQVRVLRFEQEQWAAGVSCLDETGVPAVFSDPVAAALFNGSVTVARLSEGGNVEVGLWSPQDGRPVERASVVPPLIASAPALSPVTRQLIQYGVLTLVLVVVFVWRRECVTFVAPLPPEQAFARLTRRGLAFAIDLVIIAPVWVPGVYRLWRNLAPGLTPAQQLSAPIDPNAAGLFWSWALVGAVFAVYGAIFELAMGATAGKRIARCFVVDEVGRSCKPMAVVIRNLVRVIEFHFPALVLLIVFTPSRQRLGDVLARTLVVEPQRTVAAQEASATEDGDRDEREA